MSESSLGLNARTLSFELYGQALRGQTNTVGLLDGIVDQWLEPITESVSRPACRLRRPERKRASALQ